MLIEPVNNAMHKVWDIKINPIERGWVIFMNKILKKIIINKIKNCIIIRK